MIIQVSGWISGNAKTGNQGQPESNACTSPTKLNWYNIFSIKEGKEVQCLSWERSPWFELGTYKRATKENKFVNIN